MDTIKEEEKYGNEGDKFRDAGRAIVGGAESFSNFFNTLIEVCYIEKIVCIVFIFNN